METQREMILEVANRKTFRNEELRGDTLIQQVLYDNDTIIAKEV